MELSLGGGMLCTRCVARSFEPAGADESMVEGAIGPLPRRFGGYELLEEIGRGGVGVVYHARQLALDRPVALKLLLAGAYSSEVDLVRFRREAAAAASLHHPNIVPIHDYGECDGQPYYAMDLVDGRNLAELCHGRPLETRRAAHLVETLARAVQHAHEAGIVHRDLKPSNVVISSDGRPQITDFGLAKHLGRWDGVTVNGQMLGSPSYVAPEQAAGRDELVGVATDIYGLGALLYHLVTGRAPFNAATTAETLRLTLEADPPAPRLLNPGLARDLETICLACLAKEPERRYPSAGALAEDCARFLEQRPIRARRPSIAYRSRKWVRRHRFGCVALSIVAALAAAGLIVFARAAQAEALARQRRAQIEQIFARALHVSGPAYSRGRHATLKDLLDETARWVPAEFGDDPLLEAGIHARIGETYCKLSLFENAVPHLEAAWTARQRLLAEDHPDRLVSLRDLGVLRLWQQRYVEAEELLGRVLAIQERTQGRDSEAALLTRHEIVFGRELRLTLRSTIPETELADYSKAHEAFAQESHELACRRWGDEHPVTLLHERNLARTLLRGELPSAESSTGLAERADRARRMLAHNYEASVRVHGPEHPNTIEAMADLGRALLSIKSNDEALRYLEACVPLAERVLGRDQMVTAFAMQMLETALRNAGRTEEANALVPRYVGAWMRTYGPNNAWIHRFAFSCLHRLSVALGQPEMVVRFAQERLAEFRDRYQFAPDSPAVGAMLLVLADARLAQDRVAEASRHLDEATEILARTRPEFAPVWFVHAILGQRYQQIGDFTVAESELLRAHAGISVIGIGDGYADEIRRGILHRLVGLYAAWGRPSSRDEWRDRLDAFDRAVAAARTPEATRVGGAPGAAPR